jgi:biopolymer transport protein ExbD/biopolymer transport protein TolR
MAVEVGASKAGIRPSMNVTPLVDVVLVLLVIFMVITPMMVKQFWLHAPKREAPTATAAVPDQSQVQLVLTLGADGVTRLNKDVVPLRQLEARLKRVFAARNDRVLFFDADPGVRFGDAAAAMDAARAGGAVNLVVLTEALQP